MSVEMRSHVSRHNGSACKKKKDWKKNKKR